MAKTTVPGLYIADGAITAAKLSSTLDLSGVTLTVATASSGDNDTTVASTAFVQQEIASLVDSSPSALNTLNELAAAIGDDANFSTTVTNSIATKLALAGGTMTGDLIINTTGSIQIPVGTTAQRPTAAQGQLRFNTTTSKPEIYNGSAWADVGGGVESVNSATGVVTLDTDDISEGSTNLYFTNARADARIAAATTDDLSEGSTNLYFTTARANSAIDGRLSGSTGVTVSNGAISIGQDVATSTSPTFQNLTLSGTDSIKVPSGTTAQRSGSPANGMLRYNSSTNEFEGYADSAWGAIGGDTTSSVDLYTATGNGSTATYDTGKNPQSENNTWVFIGGVYQPKSTYSFSGTEITLSENLPNGEDLEVITGTVSTYNPTDAILGQYNVTTSNTASYDTSLTTENENNVFVFVDGVYQPKSSYTYSGSTLTLDAVPTSGMSLEVLVTRSMNAATVTTGFLADDAVTTVKILDANVTAGKLASSLDLTGKTVTVATASAGDNDTSVASTAFVRQEITSLVDSAPAAMDTLNELAAALGDDANFSTTVNNSIALKAPLASPTFTGNAVFDTTTLVVDATNNRVGIGTDNPTQLLSVSNSSGNAHIQLTASTTGTSQFTFGDSGGNFRGGMKYVHTDDELFLRSNGSDRLTIDSSGNVGIGIIDPDQALEIGAGGKLKLSRADNARSLLLFNDNDYGTIETSNDPIKIASQAYTRFDVGGSEKMRITSEGNVEVRNGGSLRAYRSGNSAYAGLFMDAGEKLYIRNSWGVKDIVMLRTGEVGIGTDSPSSYQANADDLVVATTGHTGITIASGTSHLGNIHFADGTSGDDAYRGFIQYEHTANYMRFATNASEAMRIDSSGRVIISSAGSPFGADSVTIDQGGFLAIRNTSGSGMEVRRDSTDGSLIDFQKDGSPVGSIGIVSGNNLKIHSTSSGHSGLSFGTGIVYATDNAGDATNGATSLGSSSYKWEDLYLSGKAKTAGADFSGQVQHFAGNVSTYFNAANARYGQIFMDGSGFNIRGWTSSGEPILYNAAATGASHRFQVAGAEKVRITNDGLTFNGDTAAADALDDYEEGTFSPTLANASNITSLTLSEAGRYVKIGSLVHFECQVEGSITSASSEARFSLTLPFNTATTSPRAVGMFAFIRGGTYSDSRFSNGQVYQGTSANSFIYVYIGSTQIPANGSFEGRLTFTYQAA